MPFSPLTGPDFLCEESPDMKTEMKDIKDLNNSNKCKIMIMHTYAHVQILILLVELLRGRMFSFALSCAASSSKNACGNLSAAPTCSSVTWFCAEMDFASQQTHFKAFFKAFQNISS